MAGIALVAIIGFWTAAIISGVREQRAKAQNNQETQAATTTSQQPTTIPAPAPEPTIDPAIRAKENAEHLKAAKEALKNYQPKGPNRMYGNLDKARAELQLIPSDSKEYQEAIKLQREIDRREQERESAAQAEGRASYADTLETTYLKQNMDVTVTVSGPENTTIKLKYVLMSRPMVYNLTNDSSVMGNLRTLGFKKVIFTDGYFNTWNFDL